MKEDIYYGKIRNVHAKSVSSTLNILAGYALKQKSVSIKIINGFSVT